MSISIATLGKLCSQATIIREQISEIAVVLEDPVGFEIEVETVSEITAVVVTTCES